MSKKAVVIRCEGAATAKLDDLCDFQKGLKILTSIDAAKLRGEILNMGFSAPFMVWADKKKRLNILDGHQRRQVLLALRDDGYEIPPLPISFVEAKNIKEAKIKLLGITSSYGTMTPEGLAAYMEDVNLKIEDIEGRFDFGDKMVEQMKKWNDSQRDPAGSPWAWKNQAPVEKLLSNEEMAIPYNTWLKGFKTIYVLFSGGKDSMALVDALLKARVPKKKMQILFYRTPLDHPGTEELVIEFGKLVGIQTHLLGKTYDREAFVHMFEKSGFPTPHLPWCTSAWKVSQLRHFVRENRLANDDKICIAIGWRKEESDRRMKAHDRCMGQYGIRLARPILEMKEDEVYVRIEKRGWPLHYCYERGEAEGGYTNRLGCVYCYAYKRYQWVNMRDKRPDLWIKAMEVLALGCASPNISDQMVRDRLRMMMGMDTVNMARRRMGLPIKVEGSKWDEPAHDPDEDPVLPRKDVTAEDFGEGKLLTNE